MIQKCSILRVLELFFKKPTTIHFIREISREIFLAPTSVRNNLNELMENNLLIKKKSKPFDGYIANRENELFLFYKRAYNIFALYELNELLKDFLHPKAIILFGSYSRGEDIESSDIDILILSKVKKIINLDKIEKKLERTINLMTVSNIEKLDDNIRKKINNGIVLSGEI